MKEESLFKKQRKILREFLKKTRDQTLNNPTISRIITKIYSKKILSKKELEALKGKKRKK